MAIDTAEKRRAAAGVKRIAARVTPNMSLDAEWRAQAGRVYSGIAFDDPILPPTAPVFRTLFASAPQRTLVAQT